MNTEIYVPVSSLRNGDRETSSSTLKKHEKRLLRHVGKAISDYKMIENGDKVMVCVSGGKDSYTLLDALLILQKRAPIKFDIIAVNLNQKQPQFPEAILPNYLHSIGVEFNVIEKDTYSVVKEKIPAGKTTCGLCSRLRRGILYNYAEKNGITKIALGHHKDDIIETFFLNLFFGGKIKAMPPKLKSDNGKNLIIRPLAYMAEKDLARYAELKKFPIIPCNLCGSQENLQRQKIKQMLNDWELNNKGRKDIIFSSLQSVAPSQLLDKNLFNFESLSITK